MSSKQNESFYIWTSLIVVIIGTFMAILDSSIVNIAIPKMMAVFQASVDDARWIITAYTLTLGAVIPITGYLSDRFGTKNVYIFALASFTIGSLLCGFAWSNTSMIIFRILQGLGGGMIMPVSMSIIFQIVPKEKRGLALGFWGIAAMAAPTIGPTLSGYIIQYLDWRLIFTINIPIGVIAVILTIVLLKDFPKKDIKQFDIIGFISSTVGIIFCLYILGEGTSIDWSDIKIVCMLIIGVFSLVIFVVNELLHPEPLLDLRILKNFSFSLSIIITTVLNMAMFGVIFIMPLFLQNLRGLTPMQAGIVMFPSAIATGLLMPIGGKLFDKIGAKPLVIPCVIILVITTYLLSKLTIDTSISTIVFLLVLRGISLGLTSMPSSVAGMNSIPQNLVARASALSNTVRQLSSSLSITILISVMQGVQNSKYAQYSADSTLFNRMTTNFIKFYQNLFIHNGMIQKNAYGSAMTILGGIIQQKAFLDAINATLVVSTIFALIAIPLAFMIKDKKNNNNKQETEHVATIE
ncbi:MAG: MFS transporter [Spirochaetes bacterium GWC1_27_15]|nr:MAG: MFS transporter [Spirochaetes bacterium GWB1_27_13]OHD24531.1 MAG: MFS transporter [Spirochaetes bacterium GWC1_27_15]